MLLVIWVSDPACKRACAGISLQRIISLDKLKSDWVLESKSIFAITRVSNDDFPGFSDIVLIDGEHLSFFGSHRVTRRTTRFEFHRDCKVGRARSLGMVSVNLVVFVLCEHDPVRDVLVVIIDRRRVKVVAPVSSPPSLSDGRRSEGQVTAQRVCGIEIQLTGVVTRDVEFVFTCCRRLEVAIPRVAHLLGPVSGRLEHELELLLSDSVGLVSKALEANTLIAVHRVVLATSDTRLAWLRNGVN